MIINPNIISRDLSVEFMEVILEYTKKELDEVVVFHFNVIFRAES